MASADWKNFAIAGIWVVVSGVIGIIFGPVGGLIALSVLLIPCVVMWGIGQRQEDDGRDFANILTRRDDAAKSPTKLVYPWVSANMVLDGNGKPVQSVKLTYCVRDWNFDSGLPRDKSSGDSLFHLKIDVNKIDSVVGNGQRMTPFAPKVDAPEWNCADASQKSTAWIPLNQDVTVLEYWAEARKSHWDGYLILRKIGNKLDREEAITGTVTLDSGQQKQMAITVLTQWIDGKLTINTQYKYVDLTPTRLKELGVPEITV